jgi:hypothetical protein
MARDDAYDTERGRAMAQTPGTMLVVVGVICLLLSLVGVGVIASGYDAGLEMTKWMEGMQPAGPQKQEMQQKIKEMENRDRTADYIINGASAVIGITLDVLILLGGLRMKATRSYGLALTGAICAIVPFNSCCCLALPIGIWALVVLVKPEVKAAFAGRSTREAPADDFDPGFDR